MIDLNKYSDREIVEALLQINGFKLLSVVTSLGQTMENLKTRGQTIADGVSRDKVDESIRRLFEGQE